MSLTIPPKLKYGHQAHKIFIEYLQDCYQQDSYIDNGNRIRSLWDLNPRLINYANSRCHNNNYSSSIQVYQNNKQRL